MMSSSELRCVFCKELFDNKDDLQIHFRKHGDPKFNDSSSSVGKTTENNELVKCDVCMEEFLTISKAITHKHKVHPEHDTKYFCSWCGKLFTMKHLYNKHVQSAHAAEENTLNKFHCDGCDVDFFLATAMVYHNKFFHRQDNLADIGQSKKVQKFDAEILALYYCPFCGEENLNKVNLHKHINDDHIDENQSPDEILRCPLCEAIFFHLDAYEVHLTYHSTDDMYSHENEIVKQVVDFSLDAVPPLMEQVEDDCDQAIDTEPTAPIDFANFLQQALNDTNDDSSNGETVGKKSKKHKKHKKSKKDKSAVITLDEFLNMNQDVFGEGLDFQGIEEVPTQVVKKQLKKPAAKKINPKLSQSSELEKLKKQGIVVKLKSNKNIVGNLKSQGTKTMTNIPNQSNATNQIKSVSKNSTCSSEDVLSKLMNQGNSQLKVVKKVSQEQSVPSTTETPTSSNDTMENTEVENENCINSDNPELKNNTGHDPTDENKAVEDIAKTSPADIVDNLNNASKDTTVNAESNIINADTREKNQDKQEISANDEELEHEDHDEAFQKASSQPNIAPPMALNPFKNISNQITIKSLSSKKDIDNKTATEEEKKKQTEKNIDYDEDFGNESTTNSLSQNNSKPSIDTLKALNHLTVKPLNPKVRSEILTNDTEKKFGNNKIATETNNKPDTSDDRHDDQDLKDDSKANKMALVLKSLSKQITVKSPQVSDATKVAPEDNSSMEDHAYCSDEDNFDDEDINFKNIKTENLLQSNKPLQCVEQKPSDVLNRLTNITAKPVTTQLQTKNSETNINCPSAEKNNINQSNTKLQAEEKRPIDVLNRLSNITAKPLFVKPEIKNSESKRTNLSNKDNLNEKKGTDDEVEIFNIEDSDDEDLNAKMSSKNAVTTSQNNSNTSANILKNLCKSVTIKSTNPKNETVVDNNTLPNRVVSKDVLSTVTSTENTQQKSLNMKDEFEDEDGYIQESSMQINKKMDAKNCSGNSSMTVLQKLSKSITIKSNAASKEIPNKINTPKPTTDKNNSRNQNTEFSPNQEQKSPVKSNINNPISNKSLNVLKNLSSNITIKSSKPQDDELEEFDDDLNEFNSGCDSMNYQTTSKSHHSINRVEQLKSLGKDIVIKSNSTKLIENRCESYMDRSGNNKFSNPALLSNLKQQGNKNITDISKPSFSEQPNKRKLLEGYDSDSDSSTKGTKITEMQDDDINSDDDHGGNPNDESFPPNMSVQSPHSSDEPFDEYDQDVDLESEIKVNKLKNPLGQTVANKMKSGHENETNNFSQSEKSISPLRNNTALSIKPYKIAKQGTNNVSQSNINRCSTSTDTVSKEVNVKTFQSQTVIEEITTTVTKTIRTVNRSVQQEIQQHSQSNQGFKTPVRPLKVQGMPVSNQRIRNFQGSTVRPAAPTAPRIRNPTALSRPVRPSNQIVPMRPNVNTRQMRPAATSPGMSNIRPKQTVIGRPLKISPNVLVSSSKPKEEPKGHFSCFKKPKESLFPVPDVCSPNFTNLNQGESSVHYSKQISKSSFNSTTKIVKDNSVATSMQSTSQMCARSEQMSKLKNVSGLKVVKTSQSKQVMQVEEQREGNATKRTTLEAIEKLQKQGLLVKKPRLDTDDDNYSEHHSNSDGEYDDV